MGSAQQTALKRIEDALEYLALSLESATTPESLTAQDKASIENDINLQWQERCEKLESDIASLAEENNRLRRENASLSTQLQEIQQDFVDLQQVADTVHDRLDGSIKQMDLLIEERKEAVA